MKGGSHRQEKMDSEPSITWGYARNSFTSEIEDVVKSVKAWAGGWPRGQLQNCL